MYPNRRATSALAYARARGYSKIVALIEDFLARQPAAEPATGPGPALFAAAAPAEVMHLKPELASEILWGAALSGNVALVRLCYRYDVSGMDSFRTLYQPLRGRRGQAMRRYANGQGDEHADKVEILRLMLAQGADPKATDAKNMTLLHRLAGETSHWADAEKLPFAELLINYGADLETRDDELQSTPLGHACRYGLAKLAALLLEHGASGEPLAGAPWTAPLAWAEQQGHAEIAALLQSRT